MFSEKNIKDDTDEQKNTEAERPSFLTPSYHAGDFPGSRTGDVKRTNTFSSPRWATPEDVLSVLSL